jgi:hypothetical protein
MRNSFFFSAVALKGNRRMGELPEVVRKVLDRDLFLYLHEGIRSKGADVTGILDLLSMFIDNGVWRDVVKEDQHGNLTEQQSFMLFVTQSFPNGLGTSATELLKIIQLKHKNEKPPLYKPEVAKKMVLLRERIRSLLGNADVPEAAADARTLADHGEVGRGRDRVDDVNSIEKIQGGNSTNYLTARIARDRPDILERMKAGEFKSVRAAAIEAGIARKEFRCQSDPIAVVRTIRRTFSFDDINEITQMLIDNRDE